VLEGDDKGQEIVLQFDDINSSWYMFSGDEITKFAELDSSQQNIIRLFYPGGKVKQEQMQ